MASFGIPDLDPSLEADLSLGMQGVEELLREHIKGDYPLVIETSRHLVEAGGKRLRPLLTLLAAQFGDPKADQLAVDALRRHYPDREIITLNVDPLGEMGGGIHCATQQMPSL